MGWILMKLHNIEDVTPSSINTTLWHASIFYLDLLCYINLSIQYQHQDVGKIVSLVGRGLIPLNFGFTRFIIENYIQIVQTYLTLLKT